MHLNYRQMNKCGLFEVMWISKEKHLEIWLSVQKMKNLTKVASIKLYTIKDLSAGFRNHIADIIYYT